MHAGISTKILPKGRIPRLRSTALQHPAAFWKLSRDNCHTMNVWHDMTRGHVYPTENSEDPHDQTMGIPGLKNMNGTAADEKVA